jgi:hypothetical protein
MTWSARWKVFADSTHFPNDVIHRDDPRFLPLLNPTGQNGLRRTAYPERLARIVELCHERHDESLPLESKVDSMAAHQPPAECCHSLDDIRGDAIIESLDLRIAAIAAKEQFGTGQDFKLITLDVNFDRDRVPVKMGYIVERYDRNVVTTSRSRIDP